MHVQCQLLRNGLCRRLWWPLWLFRVGVGPPPWLRTVRKAAHIQFGCTVQVRFADNSPSLKSVWLGLAIVLLPAIVVVSTPGAANAETRREARGWLQLERDQQTYRERVEPLDLRDQRRLETIERSQRNELRAFEQQQRRELRTESRSDRLGQGVDAPRQVRRRDPFLQQRQAVERKRLQFRMQQDRLPYGR